MELEGFICLLLNLELYIKQNKLETKEENIRFTLNLIKQLKSLFNKLMKKDFKEKLLNSKRKKILI